MRNSSNLEKLKNYLLQLGYTDTEIGEIISLYTSVIPVLANISLRIFKENKND